MLRALLERDIVPDVIVGCSAGRVQRRRPSRPRRASAASSGSRRPGSRSAARRCSPGGRLSRAWNLLTRDDHLFSNQGLRDIFERGDTADTFEELVIPLRVVAADLDTGDEVVFARGPARSPRCWPAPRCRASTRPIRHDGRTLVDGAVVDTVPLWHALAGPVDRIYVMNVAGDLHATGRCAPRSTSPSAPSPSAASSASTSSCAACPRASRSCVLPAPVDDRELFDFSGGRGAHGRRPRPRRRRRSTTPSRPSAAGASSAVRGGAATPRSADARFSVAATSGNRTLSATVNRVR